MPQPDLAPLHRTLYVSVAALDACGPEIAALVGAAARHNDSHAITGVLGFSGQHFAQVLEGPRAELDTLMARIRRDPRHRLVAELPPAPADDGRWFPGWSLGYRFDTALEEAAAAAAADTRALARLAVLLREDVNRHAHALRPR